MIRFICAIFATIGITITTIIFIVAITIWMLKELINQSAKDS